MQILENRRLMAACITMEPVLNDMGRYRVFADGTGRMKLIRE